ncbi:hypothetical protein CISG_07308 [Coccidioides immitis RMSCC 3703]|uniref:Uncharacterized protein n=1 Tax=Coccidioides immitis RMSCC 3703 TaxID=454286 RepID=A0A0J8R2L0_COCIT|nr:hypothetical protein CISG_07308 [Coccidioides immitis RMSCC 3703]
MDITGKIIRDVLKPPPTEEELNFELDFWEDADGEDVLCEASPPGCLVISSAVKRSRGGKASRTNRDFVKQPLQHLFHQPFAGPVADALRILDL